VFETSQTAVAFGISGLRSVMTVPFLACARAPLRKPTLS
jgi:hypothetical protein